MCEALLVKKRKELTGREIGTIVSAVKRGSSYNKMAKNFGITRGKVREICESRGVSSKHNFPHNTTAKNPKKEKTLGQKLRELIGI